jgi:aminoglycoside phosphotransferase family enzyme
MSKLIDDLLRPEAYPEKTKEVTLAQTHISNVFICDNFVYKLKKSVDFGFLDFSTLEKRKFYCEQEVELNNRFSEGVYLGVFPVTLDSEKHVIDGKGETVEYAVKMKRLALENLLKSKFKEGTLTSQDIIRVAEAVASFHKSSRAAKEIAAYGKIEIIKFNTDENFEQTQEFIGKTISKTQHSDLKKWTNDFYKKHKALFAQRISEGKIKDCHGDLHMEHICLTDPIIIFDCIEFNERFRYSDTASDIAFLLMDLEYNEGWDEALQLKEAYCEYTGERDIDHLINFYKVYRAYVRGKVTSFMLNDPNITSEKKKESIEQAKKYFALAKSYIKGD